MQAWVPRAWWLEGGDCRDICAVWVRSILCFFRCFSDDISRMPNKLSKRCVRRPWIPTLLCLGGGFWPSAKFQCWRVFQSKWYKYESEFMILDVPTEDYDWGKKWTRLHTLYRLLQYKLMQVCRSTVGFQSLNRVVGSFPVVSLVHLLHWMMDGCTQLHPCIFENLTKVAGGATRRWMTVW